MQKPRLDETKKKTIILILAGMLLLLTYLCQQLTDQQDTLTLLRQGEPAATRYKEVEGAYKTYALYDKEDNLLSYGVIAGASGYGGPLTMLTDVSSKGTIVKAVLLDHSETPLYLKKVLAAGYPEVLEGKAVTNFLAANEDVDMVSGATLTTKGILLAVEKGMFQVGKNQLGLTVPQLKTLYFQWQDGLVGIVLLFSIFGAWRNLKKLRPWILVAAALGLGFVANTSLTIGNYTSIIALKLPNFLERPIWYVVVIGVLLVSFLWGRNFYCSWLCPFGAVQEGTYKALNLANYQPNPKLISFARKSRWFFLWLAVMLAFLYNNPGIASYEPFGVFFKGEGNTSQWIIMLLVLLFSIFILRFWCRCFCPMGAFLDFVASCKRKGRKLIGRRIGSVATAVAQDVENCSTENCSPKDCPTTNSSTKDQPMKGIGLSSGDKMVLVGILLIDFLILGALLQNIMQ